MTRLLETRSGARRAIAGLLLVSVAAALAVSLPAHSWASATACQHTASAGTAVSPSPASSPECDHTAGTACATMLGCVALPTALAAAAPRFSAQSAAAVAAPFVTGALHGRLGLGPPTPPPNS